MAFASHKPASSPSAVPAHRAFILRCWRETGAGPDGQTTWRFCLVEPGNAQTERGFADLEALVAYLRRELEGG